MHKYLIIFLSFCFSLAVSAENRKVFVEASDLTIIGKVLKETPNPYHRLDTVKYKGFTKMENMQVRMSSGIAVAFKTDSPAISIKTVYGDVLWPNNTGGFSARGYDLYIRKDGRWLYAGAGICDPKRPEKEMKIVSNMDNDMKECLLYLPLYSEVKSVKIGVDEGALLEPLQNPFGPKVAVFGSSYTQGSCTSRAGMTYLAQLSRKSGVEFLSLGCGGNCRLQPYFADALCDTHADAFLFDTFSNPGPDQIRERLFPFIEKIQKAHPGKPLIFQRTIRRERCNFDKKVRSLEEEKIFVADSMMNIAMKKYPDVYFIAPNATADDNNATVDGVHPDNYGYTLWAESIRKPLLRILKKYKLY